MKVLQISKFYPPVHGGIEQVAFDISEGLAKEKNQSVDVLCVDPIGKRPSDLAKKYKIFRQKLWLVLFSTPFSFSFITKWHNLRCKYDIVHVHLPNPLAVLSLFIFPPKGKIILHWHSDIVKQKKLLILFYPFQRWILKKSSSIIVTSPIYGKCSPSLQNFQDKIRCIPIGVNTNDMPINLHMEKIIKDTYQDKKIVFTLGRLVYYKGINYLIDASKLLPDDYVVLIGGAGPLYNDLEKQIVDNNLSEKVILLDSVKYENLSSYYKCCDIFCLPSIHESEAFGVVQLEAMSFSKPLVSTDIPGSGVSWVNQHRTSGIVVAPCNPEALAKGILEVMDNNEKYSRGSKERFEAFFTKDLMVNHVSDLYLSLK
ncbi:TPA: glycosyltransferase [Citrobacter farmeri]|nr:glycosyltransferase [Citrobacter farmeri]HCB1657524.1 glycosyltransferase [Citrobacter farmeri]HCB1663009.1 glycosyltransferase [Citrobacter farmeri]HCB1668207.1 glycosyltransferase [Citrobacter farmeri]HCB1772934.1 glycosyltransferase [Citrobacter farmeri]